MTDSSHAADWLNRARANWDERAADWDACSEANADAAQGVRQVERPVLEPDPHSVTARHTTSTICSAALTATTNATAPLNSAAIRCSQPSWAT